jgi:hypothetical protein
MMSECLACEETGVVYDGDGQPFPCPDWRHRCRPTLSEIASALREGREPPRNYMLPKGSQ